MKKLLLSIISLCAMSAWAQENQSLLQKNLTGIQAGVMGVEVFREHRISQNGTLHANFGLAAGIFGGTFHEKTGIIVAPKIAAEYRNYFNIEKRYTAGRNIKKNAANYLAFGTLYVPNWLAISNVKDTQIASRLIISLKYGIRRNLTKKLSFDFNIGPAYVFDFYQDSSLSGLGTDLNIKIGYLF